MEVTIAERIRRYRVTQPQKRSLLTRRQQAPPLPQLAWPELGEIEPNWKLSIRGNRAELQRKVQWHLINYENFVTEGFNLNALVYEAVMYKVRATSTAPLRVFTGSLEQPEPADSDSELAQLIARPNPWQGMSEMQQQATMYLNISGNAFFWMVNRPAGGGLPKSIYALRPDFVYVVCDVDAKGIPSLIGYLYVPEGKQFDEGIGILPQDMAHVKLPNPLDPYSGLGEGLSPLLPAANSVDVDNNATRFIKLFFERGGVPPYFFTYDQPLDPSEVARIREINKDLYGGWRGWTKHGILDKGADVKRVGLSFKEMGFEGLDERNEARIIGPFGVPVSLLPSRLGTKSSTYNNRESDRRMFWEDTFVPELRLFENELRFYLNTDTEFIGYDFSEVPALRRDTTPLVESWAKMVSWGVPKDVAAQVVKLPLPALPDDGVGYLPFSVVPIAARVPTAQETPDAQPDAEDEDREES